MSSRGTPLPPHIDAERLGKQAPPEDLVVQLRAERAALITALDLVDEAIVLLDPAGIVTRANRAASDLLQCSTPIRVAPDGRLSIDDGGARDAFTKALRRLLSGADGAGPAVQAEQVPLPRLKALPLMLTMHALMVNGSVSRHSQAAVVVRIWDPETSQFDRVALLQLAYGLTPAEVKLVQALNEGLTLKEFALRSGMTYETVRSYVKRVLSRVGARSQADLMRLTGGLR